MNFDPIAIIARKELLESHRERRFWWPILLPTGLLALSMFTAWSDYSTRKKEAVIQQAAERERWLNQGNKSPHSAAHYGVYAFTPRTPLSFLDPGVLPYTGSFVFLEPHEQKLPEFSPIEDSPAVRRLAEFSPSLVLQTAVPLVIALLLRQIFSLGISPWAVAAGKVLGATGPLFATLLSLGTLSVLVIPGDRRRTLLMIGALFAYYLAFAAVTLAISIRAHTSRMALGLGLMFWFIACLAAPRAAIALGTSVHPAPVALDHAAALLNERLQAPLWYDLLASVEKRLMDKYGTSKPSELPVSASGVGLIEEEAGQKAAHDRHYARLYGAYLLQDGFYQASGIFSPSIGMQSISMSVAQSDFAHVHHFTQAAETYRTQLVGGLNANAAKHQDPSAPPYAPGYNPGREVWASIPAFNYEAPSLAFAIENCRTALLTLAGWVFASLSVLALALRQVR